jgi:hypothetical protein
MYQASRVACFVASMAIIALAGTSRAQDEKEITPDEFRKAVPVFMDDPSSDKGKAAAKVIIVFVARSKDVVVEIGKEETKWFGDPKDEKYKKPGHYLVAYMAGSALAQLDNKKTEHDAHAGLLQVFKLYEKFKKQDKDYKNAELDMLMAKEKDGKLKAYLADLKKKGDK